MITNVDVRASQGHVVYTVQMVKRVYRVVAFKRSRDARFDPIVQGSYAEKFLRGVK